MDSIEQKTYLIDWFNENMNLSNFNMLIYLFHDVTALWKLNPTSKLYVLKTAPFDVMKIFFTKLKKQMIESKTHNFQQENHPI